MTADVVVAACRQEIDNRKQTAAFEAVYSRTRLGRRHGKYYVAALDAFTAILNEHEEHGDNFGAVFAIARALGVPVDGQ